MGFWGKVGDFFKDNIGGIIGGGANIVSSVIGAQSAKATNEAQIASARELFDKQKTETDTSHVREVADLRAAGLNPILSAKYGGASSATGQMPNLRQPYEAKETGMNSAYSNILMKKKNNAEIQNINEQTRVNSATTLKIMADTAAQKLRNIMNYRLLPAKLKAALKENRWRGSGLADWTIPTGMVTGSAGRLIGGGSPAKKIKP